MSAVSVLKESDVRRWLKRQGGEAVYWVEPTKGGTVGFVDALVVSGGQLWPLELKAGGVDQGWWTVALRPAQRVVLRSLTGQGVRTGVLVGAEDGRIGLVNAGVACLTAGQVEWIEVKDWGDLTEGLRRMPEGEGSDDGLLVLSSGFFPGL